MSNQANLTSEDRSELELMLTASPSLRIAHELKEELIAVYNSDITASGGMRTIKKWLISARVMFGSAADTLESHLEEICNYFTNRTTSGVTEGINTRIKLIIRQSYGFKNFDLMKEKLLACLSPYWRESHPRISQALSFKKTEYSGTSELRSLPTRKSNLIKLTICLIYQY